MALTPEHIEEFFAQREMPFTRLEDDTIWYAEFQAEGERFEFFVNLDEKEGWVYFTINPFVPTPDPGCVDNLSRHLARLNFDVTLAKFVLDEEGDVALTVELPTEDMTYTHFVAALKALTSAAGEHHDELWTLSQDTTAISSYL